MDEFQRQYLMDFGGVVPVSFDVTSHHRFEGIPLEVRPGKSSWVEQHFANVLGKEIPVPDPEMGKFVSAEKQSLQVERREDMVDAGCPLGHTVVVYVFRLDCEVD